MSSPSTYLRIYAEAEARQLDGFSAHFQQALVIPAYRESTELVARLEQLAGHCPRTLFILVLNRPSDDHDLDWVKGFFQRPAPIRWQSRSKTLQLTSLAADSGLLLVDRALQGAPIARKQGVGLARKIGADILCALIEQGLVDSPWIANTDADALLPDNYFSVLSQQSTEYAACLFPFRHIFDDHLPALPTLLYELSLHYYVAGLKSANSVYAYHSVGSTIAVNHQHYRQVRGFPKRAGAEDFYLLNKLAKTGAISSLTQPLIQLQARESDRVPLGTGPAVRRLRESADWLAMPLYHPLSFRYLRAWLAALDAWADTPGDIDALLRTQCAEDPALRADLLITAASALKLSAALEHARQHGKQAAKRRRHLQDWFDAFRTLKLIHWLRDNALGMQSFRALRSQRALLSMGETMRHSLDRIEQAVSQSTTQSAYQRTS